MPITLEASEHMAEKRSLCICIHLWQQFSRYTQFVLKCSGLKYSKNHVAHKLLQLRDLFKCPDAENGNNTHSKEMAQRITSIFVQHD